MYPFVEPTTLLKEPAVKARTDLSSDPDEDNDLLRDDTTLTSDSDFAEE